LTYPFISIGFFLSLLFVDGMAAITLELGEVWSSMGLRDSKPNGNIYMPCKYIARFAHEVSIDIHEVLNRTEFMIMLLGVYGCRDGRVVFRKKIGFLLRCEMMM